MPPLPDEACDLAGLPRGSSDRAVNGALFDRLCEAGTWRRFDELTRPWRCEHMALLESLGYTVLPARDGVEALEIYQKHPPPIHLVILDMVMPRMNGRETFIALRTLDPKVKLLLSSGYSLEGQARELLGQGEVGFLQKPYTTATLSAKLRELL